MAMEVGESVAPATAPADPAGRPSDRDDETPRRRRPTTVLAVGAVAVALGVLAVVLDVSGRGLTLPRSIDTAAGWPNAVAGLAQLLPGLLVLRDRPRHPIGWVLVASGVLWMIGGLASAWMVFAVYRHPELPGAVLGLHLGYRWGAFAIVGLPLLMVLFPDGRFPRPRAWRAVAVFAVAATAVMPVVAVLVPADVARAFSGGDTPAPIAALPFDQLTLDLPWWPTIFAVARLLPAVGLLTALVVVAARYRAARGRRRLQMRWLVWAGAVSALAMAVVQALPPAWLMIGLIASIAVTSSAVVVAITRHRLYDIDRLLPTTVVALALGLLVLAVDGLVLLVAGAAFGGRDAGLLAVAIVAVLYTPLRSRLWGAARRLTRGSRDDPYAAVATLAGRLETAVAPGEQLAALARSVAEAFRLPYVRVEIDRADGALAVVEHGHTDRPTAVLPIRYRDETIGRVVVDEGRRLSDADQRLLGDLLRQAAAAARAGALSASLQQARVDLVTAREEERRRLRRDLHDSLGPGLGAVTLRIETARGLAARDPAAADGVLAQAVTDVGTLLADVRRLVHDLRPPALDELGLLGALRSQARRLSGDGLVIEVDGEVGELPAAAEVAAFRIASEAMTNVVRHAGATRADVTLEHRPDRLVVTVADDGRGIGADVVAGVGTLSLRERAAELGGRTSVSCPPDGGTVVTADLPLEIR
ncbi:histidine kinase/DNA gyrase B/HSP90-like ATPase [Actinomycetospora succinea]|uniref:histidine kinase n=1 Tax=Actinomycetospora succinea TaxID=663603 RepID=A0A4R6UNZ5_9PSEU|nr:sensor histidine kinase [Actinomycetospora succinea]TDQ47349.1 histidine kinase/DNA gyrase B/HSP90-like ATPase [Actinomycetospora succinea]